LQTKQIETPSPTFPFGTRSTPTLESVRAWAAALPNRSFVLVPDAGHFPQVENPEDFFPVVEKFLQAPGVIVNAPTEANVRQAVPIFHVSNREDSFYYVDGLGFKMTNKWIDDGKLRWCWLEHIRSARPEYIP
jgi:hypothetical protein